MINLTSFRPAEQSDSLSKLKIARTSAEFRSGVYEMALQTLRKQGWVKPWSGLDALGVEGTPTYGNIFRALQGHLSNHRADQGGAAMDKPGAPPQQTYAQRRYDFISAEEGIRDRAYDDSTGRPVVAGRPAVGNVTVGIGFNMDRPDARAVLRSALGLGDDEFNAIYRGDRKLSPLEVRRLFDHTSKEAEQIVSERLRGVDLPEHQRVALVSLAFNHPGLIGPKLISALRKGDLKAARDEILFNSNKRKIKGLAKRRFRESVMFSGAGTPHPTLIDYLESQGFKSQLEEA